MRTCDGAGMTLHALQDAYPTTDGYGIRCTCGHVWEWNGADGRTLDDMARDARAHVARENDTGEGTTCDTGRA